MIRILTTIFCDDVRLEVGNKFSYMGCYTGQLFVHALPLTLPKLCVAMQAVTPADNPFKQIKFHLLKGDEILTESVMIVSDMPVPPRPLVQSPGDELRLMVGQIFQISPFLVTEPCVLRARAITEDEEELKGGGLAIALSPPPFAGIMPSNPRLSSEEGQRSVANQIHENFSSFLSLPKKPD
jgi:hypothetical protein